MPHLVVVFRFNPPSLRILGDVREETIAKIERLIPQLGTTAQGTQEAPPVMEKKMNPAHYCIDIQKQYANHLARSHMFVMLVELLEDEGWKMKGTHSITHPSTWKAVDAGMDTTRIFFRRAN